MYRNATIAEHPFHPALVVIPIVYYASTVAALVAFGFTRDPFWFRAALTANVIGVVAALVAAVPGAVELVAGHPMRPAVRRVGRYHTGFNLLAVALFGITAALLWIRWSRREPVVGQITLEAALPLGLAVVGLCASTIAATIGWALRDAERLVAPPSRPRVERPIVVGRTPSQVRH